MSEGIERRTFLIGLAGIVEALAGSAGFAQEPPKTHQELVSALRDYILAQYDTRLKIAKEIPQHARERLAAALTAVSIERDVLGQLEAQDKAPALEKYFEKNDLQFHHLTSSQADFGYTLQRVSPAVERTFTLFERATPAKVEMVEEELITNITSYAAMLEQKARPDKSSVMEVGGYCRSGQATITLFPKKYRNNARIFHEQVLAHAEEYRKQFDKPDFLDQFIEKPSAFSNRNTSTLGTEFWVNLGRQMLFLRFEETVQQFPKPEDLITHLTEVAQRNVELHEAMHTQDAADWTFINAHSPEIQKDLRNLRDYHFELRGGLSTLAHGDSAWGLAWQARMLGYPKQKSLAPHFQATEYVVKKCTEYILTHPKDFPAFTFTSQQYDIVKQFPKLSDKEVKTVARDIFAKTYKGKTLRDYIADFAPEKK